jgi:hypothetical protein
MKNIIKSLCLFLIPILFSCDPDISNPQGTGNLGSLVPKDSKVVYVAIGNSLSAGMQGNAVFAEGQQYSFPNLLAKQLGVENFVQPSYPGTGLGERMTFGGFSSTGSPIITSELANNIPTNIEYNKPFNNLGVPGAIAYDLLDESEYHSRTVSRQNPFYDAVLRDKKFGKSILDQAIALQPNFITLWMGNNDVLGYATSGGTVSTTVVAGEVVPTPTAQMAQIYAGSLQKLTLSLPNTKILLFNIPNVIGVPFFNVIPWNALVLDDVKAAILNNVPAYKQLGFTFKAGANGFIAESPKSPGKVRQLTSEDHILLTCPQDSLKAGWGSLKPIPNQYVLDKLEVEVVNKAINEYNGALAAMPSTFGANVKLIDMYTFFTNILLKGYPVPGSTTLTSKFISGEMFSLDGVHPTSKGYGMITNEIIKFINENWGSDIPLYPIQNLPTTQVVYFQDLK